MALDELVDQLDSQTTRRTIVKTGAKIAYAAPLVAASFKLSGGAAGAVVISGGCGTSSQFANCGGDVNCFCTGHIADGLVCSNNIACADTNPCTSDTDCADGWFCQAPNTGSCGQVCIPYCGVAGFSGAEVTTGGLTNAG